MNSDDPTNEELVRRATAGDVSAFGVLYDRTVRLVRAVAADAGPDAADDVTHDVFLRAFRTLGSLRAPSRFGPWLVGIARLVRGAPQPRTYSASPGPATPRP